MGLIKNGNHPHNPIPQTLSRAAKSKETKRQNGMIAAGYRYRRTKLWSWRRDLNPRPSDYKSDALPAELRQPEQPCFPPKERPLRRSRSRFTIAKITTGRKSAAMTARIRPGAMIPPLRMPRRTKATIIIVLLVLLLLALAAYLRRKAPPEAARLLPESDCILYFNLRPLRAYTHFDQHQVPHDPQYQSFIDATGFEFERDLDEVAFGLHRMPNPLGPNGAVAFSEVFLGHIDGQRLTAYLGSIAARTEEYAGHTIYDIPSEGRTVRVAELGYDMVAASNTPTPEQIHSMLDRYRTSALPFSGSSLLTDHYSEVPLLSMAWGIGKISVPLKSDGIRIMGFHFPIALDTTFIGSLRWAGALHLRIEEIAPTELAATVSSDALNTMVAIGRAAENNLPSAMTNADIRDLLNSTDVEHKNNRAVVTATLPIALLQKLVTAPNSLRSLPQPGAKPAP